MPNHFHASGPPVRNGVLAALPAAAFGRLKPHLEHVALHTHDQLLRPHAPAEHVYFPESGMVSRVVTLSDGAAIEAALVGREGLVNVLPALGARLGTTEAMVQIAGTALRTRTEDLRREVGEDTALYMAIVRFLQAELVQVTQSVACIGHHTLRQRLARWLLMAHDAGQSDEIALSHEFLAMMLGVRRPGVTIALGELKTADLIATSHGRIVILNRKGLEAVACECYATVKAEYERLLT